MLDKYTTKIGNCYNITKIEQVQNLLSYTFMRRMTPDKCSNCFLLVSMFCSICAMLHLFTYTYRYTYTFTLKQLSNLIAVFTLCLFSSNLPATTISVNTVTANANTKIHDLKTLSVQSVVPMREFLQSKSQMATFDNVVKLVTLADGTKAVFKPVPPEDIADAHAEVAAFKAAQFLGFPEIPPTVIRKINGEIGSLQLYVEPSFDLMKPGKYQEVLNKVASEDLANLKLFYFVFGQWDTGPQNLIVQTGKKNSEQFQLVAIDNSGIKSRQYVHYGNLPFVRVSYSDSLNTNDWHLPFPFQKVQIIDNPTFAELSKKLGKHFPEKILANLSRHMYPFHYVIYKNSLWVQFHQSDPFFVMSHTNVYPEKSMEILKNISQKDLEYIFSEAKGSDFLTKEYLEAILERRDQVIKAYDN